MTTAVQLQTSRAIETTQVAGAIAVHAVQTGSVRVRINQVQGKGSGPRRLLNTLIDRTWSDWLPIYAWIIEHPEGLIVVDTGETARTAEAGYFPAWHPYFRRGVELRVTPDQEIGPRLEDRWLNPKDVRWVIMTHLHTDHAGGLHHFPNSEILIHRNAFTTASGWPGRLRGFLPNRWPTWLQPALFDFERESALFGPFARSLPLTKAGDVVIVPTPGHTADHVSVVVRTDDVTYFFAGDASYTQDLMLDGHVDGLAPDETVARDTLRRIRQLAAREPLVYLPTHDPASARRLAAQEVVPTALLTR